MLILSKADLSSEEEIASIKNLYLSLGYKILVTSVYESRGMDSLREMLASTYFSSLWTFRSRESHL